MAKVGGRMEEARKEILEVVRELPGSTTRDIADLMPHVPFGTVGALVHTLKAEGAIVAKGLRPYTTSDGKQRHHHTYFLSSNPTPVTPTPRVRRSKPTTAGYEARIKELEAKVADLTQWRANALERYPDLGVEPVVLKARKLVATEVRAGGDNNLADEILAGRKDTTLMVRVAIKALEEAND